MFEAHSSGETMSEQLVGAIEDVADANGGMCMTWKTFWSTSVPKRIKFNLSCYPLLSREYEWFVKNEMGILH